MSKEKKKLKKQRGKEGEARQKVRDREVLRYENIGNKIGADFDSTPSKCKGLVVIIN
jgi:hypothetical protein